jgi:hypothetical protein
MSLFTPTRAENQYVVSYITLRRCVGWLGIALPIVLIGEFGLFHAQCPTPPSISHYYYTALGSYFTGTLCAVALFLFAYNGPATADRIAAFFAACCALGVVFCPTNAFTGCDGFCNLVDLPENHARNFAHYTFAGLLFATFAFFSLCLFTRTHPDPSKKTRQKKIRNGIFYICGTVILVSIACIGLLNIHAITRLGWVSNFRLWTFVFETSALFAFGISWLVKGEMIFPDRNKKTNSSPHHTSILKITDMP